MAQSIIYKGQKYVRVDSVKPRARRVRVDTAKSVINLTNKIVKELKQAGIKANCEFETTTYNSVSNYRLATIRNGFSILASEPSQEFYDITKKYESEANRLCKQEVEKEVKDFKREHPDAEVPRPINKDFLGTASKIQFPVCYSQAVRYNFS